jgi:hypothetical protein
MEKPKSQLEMTLLGGLRPFIEGWDTSSGYLQIDASGFIGQYGRSMPEWNTGRTLRAFFGLGMGLGLFQIIYKVPPLRLRGYFVTHRQQPDESWLFERKLDLNDELNRALSELSFYVPYGFHATEATKLRRISSRLSAVRDVFSCGSNAESLILASQWLFDSYTGHDQLLNNVQAMVVDKATSDEIGLRRLLGNRCAYFIGTSHEERAALLDDFHKIYDVRSEIVHLGKSRHWSGPISAPLVIARLPVHVHHICAPTACDLADHWKRHAAASDPLSFERFDWIDIVDAAPIPLAFDFRAPRQRQMIQQVRQRVFGPIFGH